MEEIITKGNLDAYTQGLKGVLNSMGEAILNGSGSSEDITYIKNVVDDIYAEVASLMSHITISIVDYNGDDRINDSQISVIDVSRGKEISANQSGEYLINKGSEYKITAAYNGSYVPYMERTASFDGVAVTSTLHITLTFDRMPECVDMGNGVKWATGNLTKDANDVYSIAEQTEYGAYFSWGNTNGQRVAGQTDSYNFDYSTYNSTSGKRLSADFPSGSTTYDAARVRLGSPWRTPTKDEFVWLLDNCTWNLKASGNTDYNGVAGYEVVGTNGNKIFLPYAGQFVGTSLNGGDGRYWSTTYYESSTAYYLYLSSSSHYVVSGDRYYGRPIRPIQ